MLNRLMGGSKLSDEQRSRVPPGQYVTEKWPVLHYGSVPRVDLATWDFKVWGEVDNPVTFTWDDFKSFPSKSITTDIHCVTRWSRLGASFSGVPIQHILDLARPTANAHHVLEHAEQGYTTNVPLEVLNDDDVLLCDEADGQPLTPEHGYPLRLVLPKRYFWKSAKWIRGLQFIERDIPGFWERYGYNNNADYWKEERFTDD